MCAKAAVNIVEALEINGQGIICMQHKPDHVVVSDANRANRGNVPQGLEGLDLDWNKQNHFICLFAKKIR